MRLLGTWRQQGTQQCAEGRVKTGPTSAYVCFISESESLHYNQLLIGFSNWQVFFSPGTDIKVTAEINNCSTRSVKPKFILYEKKSFFAQGKRRICTNEILREKSEGVESSRKETVTKVITIPRELPPSILNSSIIKLEYRLKVNCIILWSK